MSVLQKTRRRFVFVCIVVFVLMLTFSWQFLWHSYDRAIIKGSTLKSESRVGKEYVFHTNRSQDISDNSYTSNRGNEFINNIQSRVRNTGKENASQSTTVEDQNSSTDQWLLNLLRDTREEIPDSVKQTLTKAHSFMEKLKAGFPLNKDDLKFLADLKTKVKTIPAKTKTDNSSLNTYLSSNNSTLQLTENIVKNLTTAHPSEFQSFQIDKHSLSNHIRSGFRNQDKSIIHTHSKNNKTNKVRVLSDISFDDLQETWNKMKRNRPYYQSNSQYNQAAFLPSFSTNTVNSDGDDMTTDRPDYCNSCFSYEFSLVINQPQLCKSTENIRLLIFISSAPNKRSARVVLRETWAGKCSEPNSEVKCLFVLGRSSVKAENKDIITENRTYGDILQIDFKDSYGNLTYKTVTSFRWAAKYCAKAKYVMKTDDDMYVNTELIPKMLEAAPNKDFAGGFCWGSSTPNRDLSSKWYVSFKMYRKQKFPPMCSGTGYILSMDVIRRILVASHNIPFFHLEDVYVSMCLQKHGILPLNILGFSNMFVEFETCKYRNSVMTSHEFPTQMLKDFWPAIRACPPKSVSAADLYIVIPYPITD